MQEISKAANILFGMGERFILAAQEANTIFMSCCAYAAERQLINEITFDVNIISKWLQRHNA